MKNRLAREGFTLLTVLMIIMVMGVMLGAVGQTWKTAMQREREEELIFRGTQIRNAITRWYKPRPGQHVATPLRQLKDLLRDPRSAQTMRYLRKLYEDPMTGKEWNIISDPSKGIIGVASTSQEQPIKRGGFPDDLKDLSEKDKYSDWLFVYIPPGVNRPPTVLPPNTPGRIR